MDGPSSHFQTARLLSRHSSAGQQRLLNSYFERVERAYLSSCFHYALHTDDREKRLPDERSPDSYCRNYLSIYRSIDRSKSVPIYLSLFLSICLSLFLFIYFNVPVPRCAHSTTHVCLCRLCMYVYMWHTMFIPIRMCQ